MHIRILTTFIFVVVLAFPVFANAAISVTEVAWMGTSVSANDEWIEIYNSGNASVNLSGWTLNASDGTPAIALSGTIGAGEYKLLERTDDTTFPGITALVIFTGALGNEGETLTLKQGGTTIETLSFAGGWPAGDATTRHTMQRDGSSWITAAETAGSATIPGSGEENDEEEEEDEESTDSETETETITGAEKPPTELKVYDTMLLSVSYPKTVVASAGAKFSMKALDYDRTTLYRGEFHWNMGDGVTRVFSHDINYDGEGFSYTYEYPGTYEVVVEYYRTKFSDNPPDLVKTFSIQVFDPTVTISSVRADGSVELKNTSSRIIDLSGWRLADATGHSFTLPKGTRILASAQFFVSGKASRLKPTDGVALWTAVGALATEYLPEPKKTTTVSAASTVPSYKEKTVTLPKTQTQVLGASTKEEKPSKAKDPQNSDTVWVLAFIVLVLVAVIAIIMLKKDEDKKGEEEEYELLDE